MAHKSIDVLKKSAVELVWIVIQLVPMYESAGLADGVIVCSTMLPVMMLLVALGSAFGRKVVHETAQAGVGVVAEQLVIGGTCKILVGGGG